VCGARVRGRVNFTGLPVRHLFLACSAARWQWQWHSLTALLQQLGVQQVVQYGAWEAPWRLPGLLFMLDMI